MSSPSSPSSPSSSPPSSLSPVVNSCWPTARVDENVDFEGVDILFGYGSLGWLFTLFFFCFCFCFFVFCFFVCFFACLFILSSN